MKIVSACVYAMNIPFVESFSHSLYERSSSDSVIVKVVSDSGVAGYGEGVPRVYVTGETRDASFAFIKSELFPGLIGAELDGMTAGGGFDEISNIIPESNKDGEVIWNAARCAVELALIDCYFRSRNISVADAMPAAVKTVTYSGVIGTGPLAKVEKAAQRCRAAGFKNIKLKVSGEGDVELVEVVRRIFGPAVSIRLDANAAFDQKTAIRFIDSVKRYGIACIEQPIPRGNPSGMAAVRALSAVPVMADESVVTIQDARGLIAVNAVDFFNLRISKCGGLSKTLAIAELARSAGIGIQLGCQVGETAILSAAGRHLAAHMPDLLFVEGSYSTHLLVEDIAREHVVFGECGKADVLEGAGLGINVREELLDKYAGDKSSIGKEL